MHEFLKITGLRENFNMLINLHLISLVNKILLKLGDYIRNYIHNLRNHPFKYPTSVKKFLDFGLIN